MNNIIILISNDKIKNSHYMNNIIILISNDKEKFIILTWFEIIFFNNIFKSNF